MTRQLAVVNCRSKEVKAINGTGADYFNSISCNPKTEAGAGICYKVSYSYIKLKGFVVLMLHQY